MTKRTRISPSTVLLLTALAFPALPNSIHADEFVTTGDMVVGRNAHCVARMPDGRVLVAGGSSHDEMLRDVEIYDPETGTFMATGSLNSLRGREPGCAALDDGRVLVMGGGTALFSYTDTAEVWDPATGEFTLVGDMTTPRRDFTTVLRDDGKVLVFGGTEEGGFGTATDHVDLFDPETNTFSLAGLLVGARHGHAQTVLENGEILLVGGRSRFDEFADPVAEIYDPVTSTSRVPIGSVLFEPRDETIVSAQAPNGALIVSDEFPAEVYSLATDAFSEVPGSPLFQASGASQAIQLEDNRVLLLAVGRDPEELGRMAEIFDPSSLEFSPLGSFSQPAECGGYVSTRLLDGSVLITGGEAPPSCEEGWTAAELFLPTAGLGGSVAGLSGPFAHCRNQATGQQVGGFAGGLSWDCTSLGLQFDSGDRISMWVAGRAAGSNSVAASVVGLAGPFRWQCRNFATGQQVAENSASSSFDCEAAGLVVNPGDRIRISSGSAVE